MNKLFFLVLGLALVVNAQYDQRHWDLNNINNNLDGVNRNLNNINNTLEGIRQEQHYRTILQDQREHQKFFYERLYQAHPDANRIINSEDFKTFISHYGKKTAQGILQPFFHTHIVCIY